MSAYYRLTRTALLLFGLLVCYWEVKKPNPITKIVYKPSDLGQVSNRFGFKYNFSDLSYALLSLSGVLEPMKYLKKVQAPPSGPLGWLKTIM